MATSADLRYRRASRPRDAGSNRKPSELSPMIARHALSLAAALLVAGSAAPFTTLAAAEAAGQPAIGAKAPLFKTTGALAGKTFPIDLAKALKKGPVVLYFFPKVFTSGCTAEAHEFAERSADFKALGATVIGMSGDSVEELAKFSTEACRSKFAVGRATPQIIAQYGVALKPGAALTSRTSFVIAPNGKVVLVHSDPDYRDHVRLTYQAVKDLRGKS